MNNTNVKHFVGKIQEKVPTVRVIVSGAILKSKGESISDEDSSTLWNPFYYSCMAFGGTE